MAARTAGRGWQARRLPYFAAHWAEREVVCPKRVDGGGVQIWSHSVQVHGILKWGHRDIPMGKLPTGTANPDRILGVK
jgi:hypothetical protein